MNVSSLASVGSWSGNVANLSAVIELVVLQKSPDEIFLFAMCRADTVSPRCRELLRKGQTPLEKGVDNICKLLVFNSVV